MKDRCPHCGKRRTRENDRDFLIPDPASVPILSPEVLAARARALAVSRKRLTGLGTALVVFGLVCALLAVAAARPWAARSAAPQEVVETAVPDPTPTPSPTINSIRVFAYGKELTENGFTAYVGDPPVSLSAELDPVLYRHSLVWTLRDGEAAALAVSSDGTSCTFTALKPIGRNELTVSCYGCELVIPVFLWEH